MSPPIPAQFGFSVDDHPVPRQGVAALVAEFFRLGQRSPPMTIEYWQVPSTNIRTLSFFQRCQRLHRRTSNRPVEENGVAASGPFRS